MAHSESMWRDFALTVDTHADAVDYDGSPLEFDPTCAFCEFREYPHEH